MAKTKRGDPHRKCIDNAVKRWEETLQELNHSAQDLSNWRKIVKQASDINGHWLEMMTMMMMMMKITDSIDKYDLFLLLLIKDNIKNWQLTLVWEWQRVVDAHLCELTGGCFTCSQWRFTNRSM